ncbi:MarR family winged helix-turn-helix transcriptional regulator [Frondihabitans sp. VKM Ac-2883]|uniref:MarR family winged helix-turn-helix transcriptional regulator n=1 Tax=Frondihabitans sp. VKM Ac-2883 TaxID=2783823 RepID=UPI00188C438E|nr:MarR family transcriptional regulator [Frondihabitans sp. VKM Ac-2883]MBF4575443.1 MarR family transcriptional regulator [Frondihabitans sp. VKM Ac-2883]
MTDSAPSSTPESVNPEQAGLIGLLGAFQHLQSQNLRMSSHLSQVLSLGSTDLRVLVYLFSTENVSPRDLAAVLGHTTGSITALIDRLEKANDVERRPHPTDRRSQLLHLTDKGRAAVNQVIDVYSTAFDGVFSGAELRAATRTLTALGDALVQSLPEQTE